VRWNILGRRQVFTTPWLSVVLLDVEQPDGARSEYHVV